LDYVKTIWEDPEILVFTSEDLTRPQANLNVDVEVRDAGGRWSATFFTLDNLEALFMKNATTGECATGLYLWAADMILVRSLSEDVIVKTVADLRATGEFTRAFGFLGA
jgi:hypothetical protein